MLPSCRKRAYSAEKLVLEDIETLHQFTTKDVEDALLL